MEWDWKAEAYTALKWLGAIVATWVGNELRKKAKPFMKILRAYIVLLPRIDKIETLQLENIQRIEVIDNLFLESLNIDEKPIFINDNKGQLIFVNNAWLKMTGFNNPIDAYHDGFLLALPEEDREKTRQRAKHYAENPSPFSGYITFINIHTEAVIKTYCRTGVVYDYSDNYFKTIGRLDILSITPKNEIK